jgi:hypothetical protein
MTLQELLSANGIRLKDYKPGEHSTICPECSHTRSRAGQKKECLSVKIDGQGVGATWYCHHCGWTGAVTNGRDRGQHSTRAYIYHAADGTPAFRKVRGLDKDGQKFFWMERSDGKGGWIKGTKGVDTSILYRLPEVIEAIAFERTISAVEGEKDVDRLWSIGIPATCNAHGASEPGKKPKWTIEHSKQLAGADLVVLGDHDAAGYEHQDVTCKTSLGIAKRVRKLVLAAHWSDCPKGGDVSDYLDAKHTREELDALIEQAKDYGAGVSGALPLSYFNELSDNPAPKPWVIKNVLARGELSSWISPPGKGKSSLFAEIAIHAAAGKEWRGYRVKQPTGVVIFAFERADLTKRRLIAHRRRDGLRNLPIAVTGKIINLLDPACADIMLATIREAEQHMRCEVGLIIVDTYAKGIAAGDGDEDKARDQ